MLGFPGCLLLLFILEKPAQIIQETSHIEFEVYFPLQLNLENAKNSMDVEGPYHYNIFFWEWNEDTLVDHTP